MIFFQLHIDMKYFHYIVNVFCVFFLILFNLHICSLEYFVSQNFDMAIILADILS